MTRLIPAMMAALMLAGCGQTGPLYMPDDDSARERYDPQGDYESNDAGQSAAPQGDDRQPREDTTDVPEGDSSPVTTTAGTVGGAASTVAPTAPAAAGQGGT